MTLLNELKKLPSIPETTGQTVWLYGGIPGPNPEDAEQREAARVCGGVLGLSAESGYMLGAKMLADRSGALLGVRHHPWRDYDHPPEYQGREYRDKLHKDHYTLESAKAFAGSTRVHVVQADIETWNRDDGLNRREHNVAMADNHAQVLNAIRDIFPNAERGLYTNSPKWRNCTLTEDVDSASMAMYWPLNQRRQEEYYNQAAAFSHARGLGSLTAWVTLSAGYPAPWQWDIGTPGTASWLGGYLGRGDHKQVHDIIIYDAFDERATSFNANLVPFLEGLLLGR